MRKPQFIARQSSHPKGLIGGIVARVMAKETAPENHIALDFLELKDGDSLLEVGAGHGATLTEAATRTKGGKIAGIDISSVMVRLAKKRNCRHVKPGTTEVRRASSDKIPYPDGAFSKVLSVHTIYFLCNLHDHFKEIFRVTAPGGRFVVCFRPGEDEGFAENFPANVYNIRLKSEVLHQLEAAGFNVTSAHDDVDDRRHLVYVIAEKS